MGEGLIYNQAEMCIPWLYIVSISVKIGSLSILMMETRI